MNNLSEGQEKSREKYLEKADVSYAYFIAEKLSDIGTGPEGFRVAGGPADRMAVDWLVQEMKKIGLQDVTVDKYPVDAWTFKGANLTVRSPEFADTPMQLWAYPDASFQGEISGEMVYLGRGFKRDYEGVDAGGKIVLVDAIMEEFWVMPPTLQAEIEGAQAIVFVQIQNHAMINDDALHTWGFEGRNSIPAFCIGRKNANILKNLIGKAPVEVSIAGTSIIEAGGESYNVVGSIPGRNPEELIIVGDHYDAFYAGFQDNASSVGLTLGIAKGLVDSGYVPEHTLLFILHGSEEYGVVATRYDWAVGAWYQVFKLHPEWSGRALAYINFEISAYPLDHLPGILATQELVPLVEKFVETLPEKPKTFPEGIQVKYPIRSGSDDFSYSLAGIPSLINLHGTSGNFSRQIFHTQFDTKETYDEAVFKTHLDLYGQLVIYLDDLVVLPLDFGTHMDHMQATIDPAIYAVAGIDPNPLLSEIQKLRETGKSTFGKLLEINRRIYESESKLSGRVENRRNPRDTTRLNSRMINRGLLSAYRIAQDRLVKLTYKEQPIYAHDHVQENIKYLFDAIQRLQRGEAQAVLDDVLWKIEDESTSYYFDREIGESNADLIFNQPSDRLLWGAGRVVGSVDLYDVIASLQAKTASGSKDFAKEIEELERVLETQKTLLARVTQEEQEIVTTVREKLEALEIEGIK